MRAATTLRLAGTALLLAAMLGGPAAASEATIDYEALEQLFGEPVTASVTGSPQRESDVPATMIIITAEDIRRSGARDIPGVLRNVPGIDVLRTSNDHADVAVRGYNQAFSPRLLVLVDGRQVYADYYGFTPWSTVPVELADIRQIEVVKGPNSALFGFNAVGGVINIVTYDAIDDDVDAVSFSAGTQGLAQGSAVTTLKIGDSAGVRLSAGYRDNDDYSTPLAPPDIGVRRGNERNSLHVNAAMNVTDDLRIGLDATYSDVRQAEFSPIYTTTYADYQTSSIKGHAAVDTRIGLLQGSVYSNGIETDSYLGASPVPFVTLDNRVTVAQLQSISRLAQRHTVRLSLEYRDNSMETTPLGGADVSYDVAAFGGMWEWQIDPSLTLTMAARLDHWSLGRSGSIPPGYGLENQDWNRSESEPSFNGGVVWHATDADTFRLLVGRGVLLPNLLNLGGLLWPLDPFGYASGVPDLEPTVFDSYELSWDRTLASIPARFRLGAFHGDSRDVIALTGGARPADGLFSTPLEVGNSETTGVEASIDGAIADEWHWGLSYKYQDVDDAFNPLFPVEATFTDFEHTVPRHIAKANLGWARDPWAADAYVYYQSASSGIVANLAEFGTGLLVPVPDYVTVSARLGYTVNDRIRLALSGNSLTDSEQRQTSAPDVGRAVFVTVTLDFDGPS